MHVNIDSAKSAVMLFNASPGLQTDAQLTPWSLFGERVYITNSYKYLGVDMVTQLNDWATHVNHVVDRARKATYKLLHLGQNQPGLLPRPMTTLWKATVRPILEYACEIWGDELPNLLRSRLEAVQNDFARRVLKVPFASHAHTDALRAELGLETLSSRWTKMRVLYWHRLLNLPPERSLHHHLQTTTESIVNQPNATGWIPTTRRILNEIGLERYWLDPATCSSLSYKQWKDISYHAVEVSRDQERHNRMLLRPRLHIYTKCRSWSPTTPRYSFSIGEIGRLGAITPERYLDSRKEPLGRRIKLFCRLNILPLLDVITKDEKWPPGAAICQFCRRAPEDLTHFMLHCPQYAQYRSRLYETIIRATPHLPVHWLTNLDDHDRVCLLLGAKHDGGHPHVEQVIDIGVTRFLRKAWKQRRQITAALNERFNRRDPLLE
jgi:hypothetical protein